MRRRRFRRKKPQAAEKPAYRINERIPAKVVFMIDEKNKAHGEMSRADAILIAKERSLDLVEVSPKAQPPVCRIADFGKIQYQKSKEMRLHNATQKKKGTKGVRISVRTGTNDLDFKQKQSDKFLVKGHKVRVEIMLRGRERAHKDLARKTLESFVKNITTPHKIEETISSSPRGFQVVVAPE